MEEDTQKHINSNIIDIDKDADYDNSSNVTDEDNTISLEKRAVPADCQEDNKSYYDQSYERGLNNEVGQVQSYGNMSNATSFQVQSMSDNNNFTDAARRLENSQMYTPNCDSSFLGAHAWPDKEDHVERSRRRPVDCFSCSMNMKIPSKETVNSMETSGVVSSTVMYDRQPRFEQSAFENETSTPQLEERISSLDVNKCDDSGVARRAETSEGNDIQCCSCGLGLSTQKKEENIWEHHLRLNVNCPFIKANREEEFVDLKTRKKQVYGENLEYLRFKEWCLCKSCSRVLACFVLLPCGHLCLCQSCADAATYCPTCCCHIIKKIIAKLVISEEGR